MNNMPTIASQVNQAMVANIDTEPMLENQMPSDEFLEVEVQKFGAMNVVEDHMDMAAMNA